MVIYNWLKGRNPPNTRLIERYITKFIMRYMLLLSLLVLVGCSPDSQKQNTDPTPIVDSSPNGFMARVATAYPDADIYQDPANMTQFIIRRPDGSVWSIHCSFSFNNVQITSAARLFRGIIPTTCCTNQALNSTNLPILERTTPYQ